MSLVVYNTEQRLSFGYKHIVLTVSRDGNLVFTLIDQMDGTNLTVWVENGEEFMRLWDFLKNNFRCNSSVSTKIGENDG